MGWFFCKYLTFFLHTENGYCVYVITVVISFLFLHKLRPMQFTKQIPNLITLLNLLCGCIAIVFAVQGNLVLAGLFVMAGIFFDFFDGLAARMLNAQSELGLQLDSLADMVTSGVVPGIVMYNLLKQSVQSRTGSYAVEVDSITAMFSMPNLIALIGLSITLASAYRLAKFNIDTRQSTSFIGLPTPANTLLIISLPLILTTDSPLWLIGFIQNSYFLLGLTILSCYLLNAEIPLFALKFTSWDFSHNKFRYFFLVLSLLLLLFLQFSAVPIIILLYVLFSVVLKKQMAL